jgi:nucleoid-associated protein EbfC
MNIQKMLKQAQEMQSKVKEVQDQLAHKEVEASVAGGKIVAKANANGDLISLKIDPAIVDPSDIPMLEELITSAVKQAIDKGKQVASGELNRITAGLGLPPGMGL